MNYSVLDIVLALLSLIMENLLYQKFLISVLLVQSFILSYAVSCLTRKYDKCK